MYKRVKMQVQTIIILFFLFLTGIHFASTGSNTPTCIYTTIPKLYSSSCIGNSLCSTQEDKDEADKTYYSTLESFNTALYALTQIREHVDTTVEYLKPFKSAYNNALDEIKELIPKETEYTNVSRYCKGDTDCSDKHGIHKLDGINDIRIKKANNITKLKHNASAWNTEISKLDPKNINTTLLLNSTINLSKVTEAQSKHEEAKKQRAKIVRQQQCTKDDIQYICVSNAKCALKGIEYQLYGVYCSSDTKKCPRMADECVDTPAQIFSGDGQIPQNENQIMVENKKRQILYDHEVESDGGTGVFQ